MNAVLGMLEALLVYCECDEYEALQEMIDLINGCSAITLLKGETV